MKYLISVLVVGLSLSAMAGKSIDVSVIQALPDKVYVPTGFDDNDNSQIVFEGVFSNSCYKTGSTNIIKDADTNQLIIENNVIFTDSRFCTMVIVPYKKVVDLGRLKAGLMKINFVDSDRSLKPMGFVDVAESKTKRPDDHLYAPVDKVDVKKLKNGDATLTLKGGYNNTCMKLGDVFVHQNLSKNIVEVLPLAVMEKRDDCAITIAPILFEHTVKFKPNKKARALIHVRSLSGQSVNEIVNL